MKNKRYYICSEEKAGRCEIEKCKDCTLIAHYRYGAKIIHMHAERPTDNYRYYCEQMHLIVCCVPCDDFRLPVDLFKIM